MSHEAVKWVFRNSPSKGAARLVLLALADHYNEQKRCAWPSVARLAQWTHLTDRAVRLSLRQLEKDREISTVERGGINGSNRYFLNFDTEQGSPLKDVPLGNGRHSPGKRLPKTPEDDSAKQQNEHLENARDPRGTFLPGSGWVQDFVPRRLQAVVVR